MGTVIQTRGFVLEGWGGVGGFGECLGKSFECGFWMKARSEGCTGLLEEALGWLLARWDLKFSWRVEAFANGFCWENFSRSACEGGSGRVPDDGLMPKTTLVHSLRALAIEEFADGMEFEWACLAII